MKKSLIILFSLFFLSSCSRPSVKNLDSQGKNIICFGDSITAGVGAIEGKDYPSFLSELLKKDIINRGVSGDTTSSALKRLEKDVLSEEPYLVIVVLGGNDVLRSVPRAITLKNLQEIIARIQKQGAIVALADISYGLTLKGYKKDFARLAKTTGSIFIPELLEGVLNVPRLKYDYVHPNEEGYRLIAQKVHQAIKDYIK